MSADTGTTVHSAEIVIDATGAEVGGIQAKKAFDLIAAAAADAAKSLAGKGGTPGLIPELDRVQKQASSVGDSLKAMAVAFGAFKAYQFVKDAVMVAARYEELGIVITEVGKRSGVTETTMLRTEKVLRKNGIAATEARQTMLSFMQAHLDLAKATDLARVAQDAAVVGGLNSSQTLQRITHGIISGQSEVLRTVGITVQFETAYKKMAKEVGVSVNALTAAQRTQARMNAVMEQGKNLTGAYEASMGSASKQMRSWPRYLEDIKVALGTAFQPQLKALVFGISDALKGMAHWIGANGPLIQGTMQFVKIMVPVAGVLYAASKAMAVWKAALASLAAFNVALGVAAPWLYAIAAAAAIAGTVLGAYKVHQEKANEQTRLATERSKSLRDGLVELSSVKLDAWAASVQAGMASIAQALQDPALSMDSERRKELMGQMNIFLDQWKQVGEARNLAKLKTGTKDEPIVDEKEIEAARKRLKEMMDDLDVYERRLKTGDPFFALRDSTRKTGEQFVETAKKAGESEGKITAYLTRLGTAMAAEIKLGQAEQWREMSKGITAQATARTESATALATEKSKLGELTAAMAQGKDALTAYTRAEEVNARAIELSAGGMKLTKALQLARWEQTQRDMQQASQTRMAYEEETRALAEQATILGANTKERERLMRVRAAERIAKDSNGQISVAEARRMEEMRAAAQEAAAYAGRIKVSAEEIRKNLVENIQRSFGDLINGVLQKGLDSWRDFAESIKAIFLRAVSEMIASKAVQQLANLGLNMKGAPSYGTQGLAALAAGSADIPNVFDLSKGGGRVGGMSMLGKVGGGVLAGAAVGYGVGYASGNTTTGIAGGAASGAAAGAAIGGVPGAIAGFIVGGVAGWFGAAQKAKETAKALAEAQKAFSRALDEYTRTASDTDNSGAAAFRAAAQKRDEMIKQANAAMPGTKNEAQREEAIRQIWRAYADSLTRIDKDIKEAFQSALESLDGNDWAGKLRAIEKQYDEYRKLAIDGFLDPAQVDAWYQKAKAALQEQRDKMARDFAASMDARKATLAGDNDKAARAGIEMNRIQELDALEKLYRAGTITTEMFTEMAGVINDEAKKAVEDYTKAVAEQKRVTMEDLGLRQNAALGASDDVLEKLRLEAQQRRELVNVTDEAIKAEIEYTHGLEREALLKAQAERRRQQQEDLTLRQMVATGAKDDDVERVRLEIAQRRELAGITDEALKAQIAYVQGLEREALLKFQQERARQREEDINIRARRLQGAGDDELERLTLEAQQRRELAGITDDMVKLQIEYVQGLEREALLKAQAERRRQQQENLQLRTAVAQGMADDAIERMQQEIEQRRELAGVTDEALKAQIEYVQGLEREALLKRQEEARKRREEDRELRWLKVRGASDQEIEWQRLLIEQRRELRDAKDDAERAEIKKLQEQERLAFKAAQASAAAGVSGAGTPQGTASGAIASATASQADRMISLLENIAANTAGMRSGGARTSAGVPGGTNGVDTMLAINYQAQARLNGRTRVEVA